MRAILTYHSIDSTGSVISTDPSVFDEHIRWLTSNRISVVGVTQLLEMTEDLDAVALTFDDAFTNFSTEAWPRLKDNGLPATLFVPTGFAGKTNSWAETPGGRMPLLSILDWPALGRLQEEGVTLGAHSRTHPDMRRLDQMALEDEVLGSIDDLERETGRRPDAFAYPYGYWNAAAASTVQSVSRWACTTELRPVRTLDQDHLLPRLDVFYLRGPARLENFGRLLFRPYISCRAGVRTLGQWGRSRLHW